MPRKLLVVHGGSAVGKTTLAKRLSSDLGYVLLAKDNFKELLYDTLGKPPTRDESTVYGLAATKALYASASTFLDSGKNVILESAFTKGRAESDIEALDVNRDLKIVQIYVTASPKVRLARYEMRIASGERHSGHPDATGVATEEYFATDHTRYGALEIDDTIVVNTDTFTDDDYDKLLNSVKMTIGEN